MIRVLSTATFLLLLLTPALQAQLDRHLRISTPRLDFDTLCGEVSCRDLLLENLGSSDLEVRSITLPQIPFSIAAGAPFVTPLQIPAGASRTLRLCFSPTIPGLLNSANDLVLTVDTGDAANLARDTLELRGRSRSASLVIEPSDLDIGGILVGAQTCRPVTIRNDGNALIDLQSLRTPGAPFTIVPAITGTLAPGGSLVVDLCFDPTSVGRFTDSLLLENGPCRNPARLLLRGAGMDEAPDIGPILQISPLDIDFDTTRCGTRKCRDITIRNVGNAPSTLDNFDSLIFPFSTTYPPTPLVLPPDSSLRLRVCYAPDDAPRQDTQLVHFNGDSRYSLTIGAVFDVSLSMDTTFGGSTTTLKIDAARDGGRAFLSSLISDTLRGVVDTAAVYEFGTDRDFNQRQDYTTDAAALVAAVPTVAFGFGTCIFFALDRVMTDLRQENFPGRRVIVLLTDGRNSFGCPQPVLAQIIADAQAAGVRIYTIGIGDVGDVNDAELGALASQTGGRYFFASSADSLLAVYQAISEDLSKGADGYIRLTGEGAAPLLSFDPPLLQFDSVRVDSTRCADLTVRNDGNAPYEGGPLAGIDAPFATATPILPPLLPGESTTVEICFGPDRLRLRLDTVRLSYYRCAEEELTATLEGVGYDSVVVEMRDRYVGRPNSIVTIPLHLLDPLPEKYEVDSIRFTVRFNKTMLALGPDFVELGDPVASKPSAGGSAAREMLAEVEFADYSSDTATVGVLLYGGRARSDLPTNELAGLNFLVLLGNSLETTVEVSSATFADGNPKVGRKNPAIFAIDSICYLPERLLDGSARYNGRITRAVVRDGVIGVDYLIEMAEGSDPLATSVEIYDRLGRRSLQLLDREVDRGDTYRVVAPVDALQPGVYFVVLRFGDDLHSTLITIGGVDQ